MRLRPRYASHVFGIALSLAVGLALGGGLYGFHWVPLSGFIVWGLAASIVSFILIGRRASKRLEPLMVEAQKHVQAGRIDRAVEVLEQGFAVAKWHPMMPGQLEAQLGMLLYIAGREDAVPHLEAATRLAWTAKAMLGAYHFKKRDEVKMRAAFEQSLRSGRKVALAYMVYAYCLRELGKKDEAAAVLGRGIKNLKKPDPRLGSNLERLKEGKPFKTNLYGEQWLQFRLDKNMQSGKVMSPKGQRGISDPNHPALRGLRGKKMRLVRA